MYALYFKKRDSDLEIKTIKNNLAMENKIIKGKVIEYNDCYFVSDDRKLLREKANEIKEKWINELKEELLRMENIKIKTKY